MIEQTSFLMMPLCTKKQRRRLVIAYSLALLAMALPAFVHRGWFSIVIGVQTLTIASLLGGISAGGPVKKFSESRSVLTGGAVDNEMVTLNLTRRPVGAWTPLDERECAERDHAHYTAYRILRWVLGGTAMVYFIGMNLASAWFAQNVPTLLWAPGHLRDVSAAVCDSVDRFHGCRK